MKKTLTILAVVAATATVSSSAYAWSLFGGCCGYDNSCNSCCGFDSYDCGSCAPSCNAQVNPCDQGSCPCNAPCRWTTGSFGPQTSCVQQCPQRASMPGQVNPEMMQDQRINPQDPNYPVQDQQLNYPSQNQQYRNYSNYGYSNYGYSNLNRPYTNDGRQNIQRQYSNSNYNVRSVGNTSWDRDYTDARDLRRDGSYTDQLNGNDNILPYFNSEAEDNADRENSNWKRN